MNVLVTGGTGVLGRRIVTRLRSQGHRARVLTRNVGDKVDAVQGDLITGAGLIEAVADMDAIIHAASATTQLTKAQSIDVVGTRRLLAMAREAGVSHVVYVSIVGMEGIGYPYYQAKLAAEAIVQENIVPWSILRATQFHTLMETFLEAFSKPPLVATVPLSGGSSRSTLARWRRALSKWLPRSQAAVCVILAAPRSETSRASPSRGSKRASSPSA